MIDYTPFLWILCKIILTLIVTWACTKFVNMFKPIFNRLYTKIKDKIRRICINNKFNKLKQELRNKDIQHIKELKEQDIKHKEELKKKDIEYEEKLKDHLKHDIDIKFEYKRNHSEDIYVLHIFVHNIGNALLSNIHCSFDKKNKITELFNLAATDKYLIEYKIKEDTPIPKILYIKYDQTREFRTFPIVEFPMEEYSFWIEEEGKTEYHFVDGFYCYLLKFKLKNSGYKNLTNFKFDTKLKNSYVKLMSGSTELLESGDTSIFFIVSKHKKLIEMTYEYLFPRTIYITCDQIKMYKHGIDMRYYNYASFGRY